MKINFLRDRRNSNVCIYISREHQELGMNYKAVIAVKLSVTVSLKDAPMTLSNQTIIFALDYRETTKINQYPFSYS
jgi:hypothetical protein